MGARSWWAFERGTLWASEPGASESAPINMRAEAVLREVRPTDAVALAAAIGLAQPAEVASRFAGARRCFAAWDGERIAAYGWASQGQECVGELERVFRMAPGEAYIWDCATLPEYRGRGLYSALLAHMLRELRGDGIGRVWIGASLDNRASIRGFVNAGFQPAITLAYARLLALRGGWISGCAGAPPALVAAARRVIIADDERMLGPLMLGVGRF